MYFYLGVLGLEKDFDQFAKNVNTMNIERDLIIYNATKENNITSINKNLNPNLMFHLKAFETDDPNMILMEGNLKRICTIYNKISHEFKKDFKKQYPIAIKYFDRKCLHFHT
jgi:hypothetical protein